MRKEIPILMSTPMVIATGNETKKMTRRVIKDLVIDEESGFAYYKGKYQMDIHNWRELILDHCPYGMPGDILWVRETFMYTDDLEEPYHYKAGYDEEWNEEHCARMKGFWKPSIHMPKEACRIFLEITDVRVERLQDISAEDAIAEGIESMCDGIWQYRNYLDKTDLSGLGKHTTSFCLQAIPSFQSLWRSINGLESWDANPWVWVVEFKKIDYSL